MLDPVRIVHECVLKIGRDVELHGNHETNGLGPHHQLVQDVHQIGEMRAFSAPPL